MNFVYEIRAILKRISLLNPNNNTELALLSLFIGALYGLNKSISLNYTNRTGNNLPSNYIDELKTVASQISDGKNVDVQEWLAGFYHDSAIHRLNALNDRVFKYIYRDKKQAEKKRCEEVKVRPTVNKMKHAAQGVLNGEHLEISEIVDLCLKLEKLLTSIMS